MVKRTMIALAGVVAMMTAVPAAAATFVFQLSGSVNATWELDDSAPPNSSSDTGLAFNQVSGDFPGSGAFGVDVELLSETSGGGLRLTDNESGDILAWGQGAQLYSGTGPLSFVAGTYALTPLLGGDSLSLSVSAVPEPATWAMMTLGLGMAGMAFRSRRRRYAVAA